MTSAATLEVIGRSLGAILGGQAQSDRHSQDGAERDRVTRIAEQPRHDARPGEQNQNRVLELAKQQAEPGEPLGLYLVAAILGQASRGLGTGEPG